MTMAPPLTVVAIMGAGRAGSTLLDTLLGSVDGCFSTGELRDVWQRGLIEGRRCGCGTPIPRCDVWRQVFGQPGEAADLTSVEPDDVLAWQRRFARTRHTYELLRADPAAPGSPDRTAYLEVQAALYRRIAEVTGASVVIDSSKRPSDAALLRLIEGIDPYVVHLVRDPRAVAHSWQRRRPEPDAPDGRVEAMPTRPVVVASGVWLELNAIGHLVTRAFGPERSTFLRYEDLVAAPATTLDTLLSRIGVDARCATDDRGGLVVRPNHTVGGNPSRFRQGTVSVRIDDEWTRTMSRRDRAVASAFGLPLTARYGYPRWPGSSPAADPSLASTR